MKPSGTLPMLLFILNLCQVAVMINASTNSGRKPYIVYMGELPQTDTATGLTAVDVHKRLLLEAIGEERVAKESIIHSYRRSFNGFVARLLPQEATKLSEQESVVSVFPNSVRKLHTTRSWDFLGMPVTVTRNEKAETNLIIGVLDTGIWTMSPSFNDEGYGPRPSKWKGQCAKGANFSGCNNKVIGATYYNLDSDPQIDLTPVDEDGHGTHTSSTASGVPVPGASLYGLAAGTARGGASLTRLAMYKVCWSIGCTDMDVLAGFDAAIADGVDVISVSIGGTPRPFFEDPIAIGSFHAMKKGVFVSCSGGNLGPQLMTIENVAPWIMTVAASGIDQQFKTAVKLGNGVDISGISINTFSPKKQMYPLISGAQAANISGQGQGNASACDWGTMSPSKVKGKIVYCLEGSAQDSTVKDLGGTGVIMSVDEESDVAFFYVIPATTTTTRDGTRINHYINSTRKARAVVYKSRTVHINAPFVASFSSRGPQSITPNILKPDIAAPGLSILAAYSELASITGVYGDNRFSKYNIISGTSMACPHVAAAAAYVKSFHPEWSPAAIKSALMTTATSMKIKQPDAELGSGSGQINPTKALDPGLVYEINKSSYISFLCKQGYTTTTIRRLTGGKNLRNCSTFPAAKGTDGLNYPSMHFQLQKANSTISAAFYRTVTNVGCKNSVYRVKVNSPEGLEVTVVPKVLSFNRLRQKKSFKVLLKGKFMKDKDWISSAALEWSDSYKHIVRSPILVYRSIFSTVY